MDVLHHPLECGLQVNSCDEKAARVSDVRSARTGAESSVAVNSVQLSDQADHR